MRQLVIKPGSIMLWKSYGKLKRWWYKLIGKNLPYNNGILIRDTQTILYGISGEPFSKKSEEEVVILEPRKQYSKVETAFLNSYHTTMCFGIFFGTACLIFAFIAYKPQKY